MQFAHAIDERLADHAGSKQHQQRKAAQLQEFGARESRHAVMVSEPGGPGKARSPLRLRIVANP